MNYKEINSSRMVFVNALAVVRARWSAESIEERLAVKNIGQKLSTPANEGEL